MESITIGTLPYEANALIYIADEQKFFKANGLEVAIKNYETGLAATTAVTQGAVDIAACAEFISVGKAFQKEDIFIIATIAKNLNELLIGRIDKGIKTVADLSGKKIGVPRKTIAEFYLGRFLDLHGLSTQDITLVDLPPSRLQEALVQNEVDAVIAWQPWAKQIENRLAQNKVVWPAQSSQLLYWNMVVKDVRSAKQDRLIKKVLRSLLQAEKYLVGHPEEAKDIVRTRLRYDNAYLEEVWPKQQFFLSLDQSLIAALEDEARWMIQNKLTTEKKVPDFLEYIYLEGLKAVKPEAVSIIR
ncbi:MAG: NrtA/SsuA/CpmA family ABC transporter substrate-binding protein [Deltaproteobacteria bacterium]|nr:NrtA/SsuA/CpmA family ABC transporter substrate-binding protein [Deltaproteobacteria bacterium]